MRALPVAQIDTARCPVLAYFPPPCHGNDDRFPIRPLIAAASSTLLGIGAGLVVAIP